MFTALTWAFILYEAIVFVAVVVIMLIEGRSVPAGVNIENETAGERTKVLAFLVGFLALLVIVFFIGS
jgi:hypothetical protein